MKKKGEHNGGMCFIPNYRHKDYQNPKTRRKFLEKCYKDIGYGEITPADNADNTRVYGERKKSLWERLKKLFFRKNQ